MGSSLCDVIAGCVAGGAAGLDWRNAEGAGQSGGATVCAEAA